MPDDHAAKFRLSRRNFLSAAGVSAAVPLVARSAVGEEAVQQQRAADPRDQLNFTLRVNGQDRPVALDPRVSLLDALRDHMQLTGTKKGCDHGQCGACTVHVNGKRILSCMTFAVMVQGQEITTIEGLAGPVGDLHPMQQAFIDHDAFQCGYCTPGQICSAVGMLAEVKAGWPSHATADVASPGIELSDAEIRERMSGNICRCAAYPNIVAAIRDIAQRGGQ
jgi:xanthine dehydrogenase YagT iron-sulfur-binding subunit